MKKFFLGRSVVFILIILVGLGVFAYKNHFSSDRGMSVVENGEGVQLPIFAWEFTQADSLNPDGVPETDIYLKVQYSGGEVQRSFIATTSASCNDLPDADTDSVPGSTTIQCYGAGLGYRFKITRGEDSYLVQRKKIEESSPEYTAPTYAYEVISEIAFVNIEGYVRKNISTLSPVDEQLGGTFMVTTFEIHGDAGVVSYEDGHNAYTADFTYKADESGKPVVTSFKVRK